MTSELLELAAWCEAAEASDQRALLVEAWDAIFGTLSSERRTFMRMIEAKAYESAAMTLVPEGHAWNVYSDGPTYRASAEAGPHPEGGQMFQASASSDGGTPALALAAASLRARASQGSNDHE